MTWGKDSRWHFKSRVSLFLFNIKEKDGINVITEGEGDRDWAEPNKSIEPPKTDKNTAAKKKKEKKKE